MPQVDPDLIFVRLDGVGSNSEIPLELRNSKSRLVVNSFNGHGELDTEIDVLQFLGWLKRNWPELWDAA